MAISEEFVEYVLDQFAAWDDVSARKMFGGAGLYCDGVMFGLIADDVAYLKVDDSNRDDYLQVCVLFLFSRHRFWPARLVTYENRRPLHRDVVLGRELQQAANHPPDLPVRAALPHPDNKLRPDLDNRNLAHLALPCDRIST